MPGSSRWKCPNGHILGSIKESKNNGGTVRRLLLYRRAIDLDGGDEVDVMAVVEGSITEVTCDRCGMIASWWPDAASLQALLKRMEKKGDRRVQSNR